MDDSHSFWNRGLTKFKNELANLENELTNLQGVLQWLSHYFDESSILMCSMVISLSESSNVQYGRLMFSMSHPIL